MLKNLRGGAFLISIILVLFTSVIICLCAVCGAGKRIVFKADYYFICYRIVDNSVSAGSLSDTVSSYGGAGYIICHEEDYYVTVSCYYTENDADSVCESLKKRDLDCSVLKISTKEFKLGANDDKTAELYKGNLNTLNSLSRMAYDCANKLDVGEYGQNKAKDVLYAVKDGLKGLKNNNQSNRFTNPINKLIAECEDKDRGFLYSKDMRYIQIAIADFIINAEIS